MDGKETETGGDVLMASKVSIVSLQAVQDKTFSVIGSNRLLGENRWS